MARKSTVYLSRFSPRPLWPKAASREEAQSGAYAPLQRRPTRPLPISRGPSPPLPTTHTLTRVGGPTGPCRWPSAPASQQLRRHVLLDTFCSVYDRSDCFTACERGWVWGGWRQVRRGGARLRAAEAAVGRPRGASVDRGRGRGWAGAASEARRVQRVCLRWLRVRRTRRVPKRRRFPSWRRVRRARAARAGVAAGPRAHHIVVAVDVCLLVAVDLVVLEVLVRLRLPLRPRARRLRLLVLVGGRVAHVALGAAR